VQYHKAIIITIIFFGLMLIPSNYTYGSKLLSVDYNLYDKNGNTVMYKISGGLLELHLLVDPHITKPLPMLYTVFINGRQVNCNWDGKDAPVYRTSLLPNQKKNISIKINDIPTGENTLQVGYVCYPDKTVWLDEQLLLKSDYAMQFSSFTVINDKPNTDTNVKYSPQMPTTNNTFPYRDLVYEDGFLSNTPNKLVVEPFVKLGSAQRYFFWRNSQDQRVLVRFILLKDWIETPWPMSNKVAFDVISKPNDLYCIPIDFGVLSKQGTHQFSVISFVNPHISFWYWDKQENDWEANKNGARAYSTLKLVIEDIPANNSNFFSNLFIWFKQLWWEIFN